MKISEEQFADLVESVSHDLHAPLRKLSILIDRVFVKNKDQFDESSSEYIGRMEKCIGEMQSLIDGLTELARTNNKEDAFESCNLNTVLEKVQQEIADEVVLSGVQIQSETLPTVKGHMLLYVQLFKNLLENSIKFRNLHEPARIEIEAKEMADAERERLELPADQKYCMVIFSDNGIGFNHVHAQKIFEPFVRLHPKSKFAGNGLGLSICKKIVARHSGKIYAESEENSGCRIILILPEIP